MNVLVVNHSSQIGGSELSLETLLTGQHEMGCRYAVALPGPGPFAERLRRMDIKTVELRIDSWRWWWRTRNQQVRWLLTLPYQVISILRWLRYLRRTRPDLVHLNINRLIEPLIAARLLKIPVLLHFRDIPSRMRYRFAVGMSAYYWFMNLADFWIANSESTAADIRQWTRRPLQVVPNALDLVAFDLAAVDADERAVSMLDPSVSHHVVMVGGLNPWKRQDQFIAVALRVLDQRSDVAFYLAGADVDAAYADSLRAMVARAGKTSHIRFLGAIDCVPSLLNHVDVVVHTMPDESFGRIFLEAMAAWRPVVAARGGGAVDIVVDGETGILLAFGAVDKMALEVMALLDDPSRRRRLGAAGRVRVEALYSVESHRQAIAKTYAALVSDSRRVTATDLATP